MPKGLSVTAYAKAQGISRQAAYKRLGNGSIRRLKDGTIDPDQAEKDWEDNRDELQSMRGAHSGKAKKKPDSDDAGSLKQLQKISLALKVKDQQREDKVKEGQLLKRDEVKEAWASMIVDAQSTLLAVGDELADKLAAESNPIRCREMVAAKIRSALAKLSRRS